MCFGCVSYNLYSCTPLRPERVPVRDRLPVVGFLRLHVRRLRHHGSRLARALLNALARSTSDSVLDRRSDIPRHVGKGNVLGNFVVMCGKL